MNRLFRISVFCISILLSITSFGQGGEGNIWYFGQNAGLDFNTGSPVAITNGGLITQEGCATICDSLGNLLFYTDGIIVWDATHNMVQNTLPSSPGGSLGGDPSSTQSGIIVPKPQNPEIYYIFTVDNNSMPNGLKYSVFDLSLNGGLGEIIPLEKNIPLFSPSTEKIHAVKHANGEDIWVITHPWNTDTYYTYLITASGFNPTPVISTCGSIHTGGSAVTRGYLKSSHDGSLVCAAIEGMSKFELFNFDNATGMLSYILTSPANYDDAYGIEFSPNDQYMYLSLRWSSELYQFDVSSPSPGIILSSQVQIATLGSSNGGALQLGPDNKIYLARNSTGYLGAINNPTASGVGCNYVDQAVYLGGQTSREGLPSFITTVYNTPFIHIDGICTGDSVIFKYSNINSPDSVSWQIFDSNSALISSSNDSVFAKVFNYGDVYNVNLSYYVAGVADSLSKEFLIIAPPMIDLPGDTSFCSGIPLAINLPGDYVDWVWSTGVNSSQFFIDVEGTYSVTGTNTCGVMGDSFYVIEDLPIVNSIFSDTVFCEGTSVVLDLGNAGANYLWSTGSTTQSIEIFETDVYLYTITNACGSTSDMVLAQMTDTEIELGDDVSLCDGESIIIGEEHLYSDFLWTTGDTTQLIEVNIDGIYAVVMTNTCGVFLDEVSVTFEPLPVFDFGADTLYYSPYTTIILDPGIIGDSYLWSTGETSSIIEVGDPGYYSVTVTSQYGCEGENGVYVNLFAGVETLNDEFIFNIFPNPTNEIINISANEKEVDEIKIYNSIGALVYYSIIDQEKVVLNVSGFNEGMYFIMAIGKDGAYIVKPFTIMR